MELPCSVAVYLRSLVAGDRRTAEGGTNLPVQTLGLSGKQNPDPAGFFLYSQKEGVGNAVLFQTP